MPLLTETAALQATLKAKPSDKNILSAMLVLTREVQKTWTPSAVKVQAAFRCCKPRRTFLRQRAAATAIAAGHRERPITKERREARLFEAWAKELEKSDQEHEARVAAAAEVVEEEGKKAALESGSGNWTGPLNVPHNQPRQQELFDDLSYILSHFKPGEIPEALAPWACLSCDGRRSAAVRACWWLPKSAGLVCQAPTRSALTPRTSPVWGRADCTCGRWPRSSLKRPATTSSTARTISSRSSISASSESVKCTPP